MEANTPREFLEGMTPGEILRVVIGEASCRPQRTERTERVLDVPLPPRDA